jgi:hypothetical protein
VGLAEVLALPTVQQVELVTQEHHRLLLAMHLLDMAVEAVVLLVQLVMLAVLEYQVAAEARLIPLLELSLLVQVAEV